MATEPDGFIEIQQSLFGYRDGHRLLESSVRLPESAASLLLRLSDLAPGVSLARTDSYWTGLPLGEAKCYALMRTWPAPEIPRPGCVWTHVLLVPFPDIARFVDLSTLGRQIKRPKGEQCLGLYSEPLSISVAALGVEYESRPVQAADALRVVRACYSSRSRGVLFGATGALDDAVFAGWSQQWPRLRRTFSFRTTGNSRDGGIAGVKFDLRIVRSERHAGESAVIERPASEWESTAAEDLRRTEFTDFRRFLWRYGSDIRRGRDRFQFLTELYLSTRSASLSGGQIESILASVSDGLPSPSDGRVLKEDLVSLGRSKYSLLPPIDMFGTLAFFMDRPEAGALPSLPPEAVASVDDLWHERSDEIVALAGRAADRRSELGDRLISRLADSVDPTELLDATDQQPKLRTQLIMANPRVLDSEHLKCVPQPELLRLVTFIPESDPSLAERVIGRLLAVNDVEIAGELFTRFPEVVMRVAVSALRESAESSEELGAWFHVIAGKKGEFLRRGFVESSRSTIELAALARLVDHDSKEVLAVGPLPWAIGLRRAKDDVHGHARQVFLAFLLAVAVARPTQGCEPLLERAFEAVHSDLRRSRLPYDALTILSRHLPELSWWKQWDACLRLRSGVVNAYVNGGLDPSSFGRLTSESETFQEMVELAERTKRGRRFLQQRFAVRSL